MKILSKYKDYYDYLTGTYGVDDKLVLDRRDATGLKHVFKDGIIYLSICDKVTMGIMLDGKTYFGNELAEIGTFIESTETTKAYYEIKDTVYCKIIGRSNDTVSRYYKPKINVRHTLEDNPNKINSRTGIAILMAQLPITGSDYRGEPVARTSMQATTLYKYPKLSDYNIHKVISAHDIYVMLSAFLAPKEIVDDTRTDIEKLDSQGFDRKTSFRKPKS